EAPEKRLLQGQPVQELLATYLVDENHLNPIVQKVFADIKETKKIDFVAAIWRALATNPQHLELCWTGLRPVEPCPGPDASGQHDRASRTVRRLSACSV